MDKGDLNICGLEKNDILCNFMDVLLQRSQHNEYKLVFMKNKNAGKLM